MSEERLKEIKDIMLTPHLDMYLSNACNELFQYVIKQKEILNKIKEETKLAYNELQPGELVIGQALLKNILELLEEIE